MLILRLRQQLKLVPLLKLLKLRLGLNNIIGLILVVFSDVHLVFGSLDKLLIKAI